MIILAWLSVEDIDVKSAFPFQIDHNETEIIVQIAKAIVMWQKLAHHVSHQIFDWKRFYIGHSD